MAPAPAPEPAQIEFAEYLSQQYDRETADRYLKFVSQPGYQLRPTNKRITYKGSLHIPQVKVANLPPRVYYE